MPQFETTFYGAQIFWLMLSFGFLYLMMSQLICPMIEEVIRERDKKVQTLLDTAESLNQEAADFHQRYQTYLMAAEREKAEKIQSAYQEMHKKISRAENKSEANLRQKIRRAERKINLAAATLNQEADQLSDQLANQLAEHLCQEEKNGFY